MVVRLEAKTDTDYIVPNPLDSDDTLLLLLLIASSSFFFYFFHL